MSVAPFVILVSLSTMIVALVMSEYGNVRRQHFLVSIFVLIAASFSLYMIFILPLDVSLAVYEECKKKISTFSSITNLPSNQNTTTFSSETSQVTGSFSYYSSTTSYQTTLIESARCGYLYSETPEILLRYFWTTIYWSSQILTWLILPIMQSYATSGEFRILRRIFSAIMENAIFYASFAILFLIFLIYIILTVAFNFGKMRDILSATANTWGLFLVILFLGYGLVEVPRRCWARGDHASFLDNSYFQLAKLNLERAEAADKYTEVLKACLCPSALPNSNFSIRLICVMVLVVFWACLQDIYGISQTLGRSSPLYTFVDQMLKRFPRDLHRYIRLEAADPNFVAGLTERDLVKMNERLIKYQHLYSRTSVQFDELVQRCIELEVIIDNSGSQVHQFRWPHGLAPEQYRKRAVATASNSAHLIPTYSGSARARPAQPSAQAARADGYESFRNYEADAGSAPGSIQDESMDDSGHLIEGGSTGVAYYMRTVVSALSGLLNVRDFFSAFWVTLPYRPAIEWWWYCAVRRRLYQVAACFLALCSLVILWSECTFFIKFPISAFAALSTLFSIWHAYFLIELLSFLALSYLSICTYFTVFRLRIFNYYQLVPAHQSDENSLLFCAILLCRLTPSMCINFLGMMHRDTHILGSEGQEHVGETQFTWVMGHMDVILIISSGFNVYFPLCLIVLCISTYLRLGTRLLNCLGFEQFMHNDADGLTTDLVNDGRQIVQREMRKREREAGNLAGGVSGRRQDSRYNLDVEHADTESARQIPSFGSGPAQRVLGSSAAASSTAAASRASQPPGRQRRLEAEQDDSDDQPIDFNDQIANRDLFEFRFPK